MKALILRDFRAYRIFFMLQVVIMLLYSYLNIRVGSVDGIVGFLVVFLPALAGVILFIGDQELIPYMASLPVSRKELVVGKYISTYLFGLTMVGITIGICWFLSSDYPNAKVDLEALISLRGFLFAISPITIIVSTTYPLFFKFGLKIGVRIVLGFFAVSYGIGFVFAEKFIRQQLSVPRRGIFASAMAIFSRAEDTIGYAAFYVVFIGILAVFILGSVFLSVHVVKQKDFN